MSLLPTQFKKPLLTSEGKSKSTWGDKPKRVGGERDYANYDICSKVQLQQRKDNCLTLKWKTGYQRIPILTTVHLSLWIEWAAVEDICKIRFFFFIITTLPSGMVLLKFRQFQSTKDDCFVMTLSSQTNQFCTASYREELCSSK